MDSTQLVFLGTGTPRIDPDRKGPCAAIISGNESILIDCGIGALHQAAMMAKKGLDQLEPTRIQRIFLTHLHSDHILGLAEFIMAPWVVGRKQPLSIYGPKGTQNMVESLLNAFREDIEVRTSGLESSSSDDLIPIVTELRDGDIQSFGGITIRPFTVHHGEWRHAFGFDVAVSGLKVVFSGDTSPCQGIEEATKNADWLIHEVYASSAARPENRPGGENWPKYMGKSHTSALELGSMVLRCQVKNLLVNHVLRSNESDEELIQEIRQGGFEGPIHVAKDFETFIL